MARGVAQFTRSLGLNSPALLRLVGRHISSKVSRRRSSYATSSSSMLQEASAVKCLRPNSPLSGTLSGGRSGHGHPIQEVTRPNLLFARSFSSTTHAMSNSIISVVSTDQAPGAIGPYSQAIKAGDTVYCSGCIPLDPISLQIVGTTVEEQTDRALKNLSAVVQAAGADLSKVVKTTVFLKSMDDFVKMNEVYARAFGSHKPARSAVEVSRLPKDVLVEIEAIVSLK